MAKYCIGIDLGGTFIKYGLLDYGMKLGKVLQLPTPNTHGAKGVVDQMIAGARQVMETAGVRRQDVLAIGMGVPGPLNLKDGIIIAMPNIAGMENCPVRDMVGKALGLSAVLENDANAAGYGEYISVADTGVRDMVVLTLGTGVGSGIVVDGKVVHGAHGIGAEMGHMIVEPNGEPCGCGQRGCLERYTSATYMAQWATRMILTEGRASVMADAAKSGTINAKTINDARKSGDALAAEAWERTVYFLALACVNIARIMDPDEIVLAGGMAQAGDDLLAPVTEHYRKMHWTLTPPATRIALARLGNDAGVIGAAGVAWAEVGKA